LALALSKIAIQSTNEFQMDSMFGFVMAGAYALALLALDRNLLPLPAAAAIVATAAAFLGLGKNEWSLVLALACFGSVMLVAIAERLGFLGKEHKQRFFVSLSATAIGLILGNLASYLFDPKLYASGWGLLADMVRKASIAGGASGSRFIEVNLDRIGFINVHLLLIFFIAWRLVVSRSKISPVVLLASLFGVGLFAAFFISTWGSYPRYFAPAFATLSVVAIWLYLEQPTGTAASVIGAMALAWLAVAGVQYGRDPALARNSTYGIRDITALIKPGCAILLPVEDAYRRKDVDFVHSGWGYEGAVEAAQQFGGRVCPRN
jgi:hypothetical protein